eukprot:38818_1
MAVNKNIKIFGIVASIIYFILYVFMVVILALVTYRSGNYKDESKKTFLKAVWKKRGIYTQILVHIYDTATDLGVLIGWGILAYDNNDYESIDMLGLFWTAIGFIIAYRILSCVLSCHAASEDGAEFNEYLTNCCLAICDIYIFRIVYEALQEDVKEPSARQKMIQLVESIFESLPQVVLQSVFIIRAQNDELLKENSSIILVGLSLGASLFSISNKFTWVDGDLVKEEALEIEFKKSFPCVNGWYVLRIIWRYSFVASRFAVFSLIWSVMGGAFLGIFIAFSFIYWGILSFFVAGLWTEIVQDNGLDGCIGFALVSFIYGSVCLISTPANSHKGIAVMHGVEMIVSLSIITWFAFDPVIDCGICANPYDRQASGNDYILMFIISGWIAITIDLITHTLMLRFERIEVMDDL